MFPQYIHTHVESLVPFYILLIRSLSSTIEARVAGTSRQVRSPMLHCLLLPILEPETLNEVLISITRRVGDVVRSIRGNGDRSMSGT